MVVQQQQQRLRSGGGSFAVASVNHLEVPAELAFIFSKMERWRPAVHLEKSLSKVSGQVPGEI